MQQLEIEKVKTVVNDGFCHKVPSELAHNTTTTTTLNEDGLPKVGKESLAFKILEYLYDVKQAFANDIATKLQKKDNLVRARLTDLRKFGFIRTGLDWRIKITDAGILYYNIYIDSTAQHSTAQHSTAQHSTAQHSTAQHSTAQHSIAQCKKLKIERKNRVR